MLERLQANGFRNLSRLDWRPKAGLQILLGDNGAGKTSLLEAVYLLATTRSFRTHQIQDCLGHGASRFYLQGEIRTDARFRLEVTLEGRQRHRRLNGSASTLGEHLAVLPVVAWTSRDSELVSGPPEERRRFLDRGVVSSKPRGLELAGKYRRILHQKRQLLVRGQGGLDSWNEMLATYAAGLIRERQDYVNLMSRHILRVIEDSGLPFCDLELVYKPSLSPDLEPEEIFRRFKDLEAEERRRQRALAGPHLDDLEILWRDHSLKKVASAGERKAVGLTLLAAHGRVLRSLGHEPIYLLDDADTELSAATLGKVWKAFSGCGQLIASSNRPEVWNELPVEGFWHLDKGGLEGASGDSPKRPTDGS